MIRARCSTERLIARREAEALTIRRYFEAMRPSLREIGSMMLHDLKIDLQSEDPAVFRSVKSLGAIVVDSDMTCAQGYDKQSGVRIGGYESGFSAFSATQLHLRSSSGPDEVRQGLSRAAEYITMHPSLRANPYVAGVTFRELARTASRLGFEVMEVEEIYPDDACIQASYDAFRMISGRSLQPVDPAIVYLPTAEFVDRFRV